MKILVYIEKLFQAHNVISGYACELREDRCFTSYLDDPAWWIVDLQQSYIITRIRILCGYNADKIENAEIRIGNSPTAVNNPLAMRITETYPGYFGLLDLTFDAPAEGRYIGMVNRHLALCRFEAYP